MNPATPSPRLAVESTRFHAGTSNHPIQWIIWDGYTPYEAALRFMDERVEAISRNEAPETVLLVEHPPIYTAGTSARPEDLLHHGRFPVHATGRGGEFTYHGPGQRVAYVMLDLRQRRPDVRAYVAALEQWIISTLSDFQVTGERREDRVGVWVRRPERTPLPSGAPAEDKIAAIGIRVRRWVTFHGISLNIDPDLDHFTGIVPCGIQGYGVTSFADLGLPVTMPEVDATLRVRFEEIFGATSRHSVSNLFEDATA